MRSYLLKVHPSIGKRSFLEERSEAFTTNSGAGGSGRDQNPAASITNEKATIAGLEPINFITLATPHLGCRDHRHVRMISFVIVFTIDTVCFNSSEIFGNLFNKARHICVAFVAFMDELPRRGI